MPLPNLILIGAQKCGNSSLYRYLGLHPEIATVRVRGRSETRFFSDEDVWRLGSDWYAGCFPAVPVRVDASPTYSEHPFRPFVAERMRELVPDARIVYLVRDPIDRLVSAWHFERCYGIEHRSFAEAFSRLDDNIHVLKSCYATQLERYLACFPQEQVAVVDQHDLRHDRAATLRRVFRLAGADEEFVSPGFAVEENVLAGARWLTPGGRRAERLVRRTIGARAAHALRERLPVRLPALELPVEPRPVVDDELGGRLLERLAPEAERLRALTGQRFASWAL